MTEVTPQDLDALRAKFRGEEPKEENTATLADVNDLAFKLSRLREVKEAFERDLSDVSKDIESTNQAIIDILIQNELTSYKAPAGTISVTHLFTAKLPQGEDKVTCFNYLKQIGRFEDMASIHSATFNSWVKEQYDLAKEAGQDEPKIPGVSDVKVMLRLSFRRAK